VQLDPAVDVDRLAGDDYHDHRHLRQSAERSARYPAASAKRRARTQTLT
jgi:hypothetical protein